MSLGFELIFIFLGFVIGLFSGATITMYGIFKEHPELRNILEKK